MDRKSRESLFQDIKNSEKKYSIGDRQAYKTINILSMILKTIMTAVVLVLVLVGVATLVHPDIRDLFFTIFL